MEEAGEVGRKKDNNALGIWVELSDKMQKTVNFEIQINEIV